MNRFTCTLISGLGALIRDTQGFEGSDLLTSAASGLAGKAERSTTSVSRLSLRGKTRTKSQPLPAFLPV